MTVYTVRNGGRLIERLPAPAILEDDAAPAEVVEALASWRDAVEGLQEPARVLREAEKAAHESTLLVRGERERYAAEIREKTAEEASELRAAERASTAAARALVSALEAHGEEVRAVAARLALVAHARAVDAALDVDASRARFRAVAPIVPALPGVDAVLVARRTAGNVQEAALDVLDRVNVPALVEAAGEDPVGFVAVRRDRDGFEISTTPRRAEVLVGSGRNGWTLFDEEVRA